jgi:hypothetical protein
MLPRSVLRRPNDVGVAAPSSGGSTVVFVAVWGSWSLVAPSFQTVSFAYMCGVGFSPICAVCSFLQGSYTGSLVSCQC